ncbi:iron-containing alcohol dehydrogenase family protein [Chloroflexota bacterium]
MINNFTFSIPVRVVFGNGLLETTGKECSAIGMDNVMVVTDEGIAGTSLLSSLVYSLRKENLQAVVYSGAVPDPDEECVEKGLAVLRQNNCQSLVGLGGGSSIDTAKAISILATNPPPLNQYNGSKKLDKLPLPLIAIPTTAGTGSEINIAAVITSHEEIYKYGVIGNYPRVAILDPLVLTGTPKALAASTGLDALTHAVESYISRLSSPMSDMYSEASLRLISANLRNFVADRRNVEAGSNMLLASLLAGIGMANAMLGIVHGVGHSIGARYHVVHGVSCGIILPAFLESMVSHSVDKFATMAKIMEPDMQCASDYDYAQAVPGIFARLLEDLDIETRLGKYGVKDSDFKAMAADSGKSRHSVLSPRDYSTEDIVNILRRAL